METAQATRYTSTETRYSVLVRNSQGATDGMVGTRSEIDAYLQRWGDPERLTATVTSEYGEVVADKPAGQRTIRWGGTSESTEAEAQRIADGVLANADMTLGWEEAGYASARDAALALIGDGIDRNVRKIAADLVAARLADAS